jgi:hypothetical protein
MWSVLFWELSELNLDEGEGWLLVVSGIISVFGLLLLGYQMNVSKLGTSTLVRSPLYLALAASFAALLIVTKLWAAREVREENFYVFLFYVFLILSIGGATMTIASGLFCWLGIGVRDDVFERRNPAATWALSGAVIGIMLVYIGSNIGEGPSFWNNVFCVVLGLSTWFGLWLILEFASRVASAITEDRDIASGLRLAGFLMALGLILARGLAGDWHSLVETIRDFISGSWPALLLLPIAVLVERRLRPSVSRPVPSWRTRGVLVAVVYLLIAAAWCFPNLGFPKGAAR